MHEDSLPLSTNADGNFIKKKQKNTWPSDKSTPEIEFTNDNMKQTKMAENWSKQSLRRLTNENGYLYMY